MLISLHETSLLTVDLNLSGKRVLVTGDNTGLGAAIAAAFAAEHARVAINYVAQPEAAQSLVTQLRPSAADARALQPISAIRRRLTLCSRHLI
jgi:NAD(P)-dependent dehydrogenase (short-subunit alcohol dehydrogenase family)